jgi:hypothetical protein
MSDVAAFLNARLDEDETVARAALAGRDEESESGGWSEVLAAKAVDLDATDVEHIARHDPARVLREVTAMRAIVEFYVEPPGGLRSGSAAPSTAAEAEIAKAPRVLTAIEAIAFDIAAVWSDHPDYDPAWRF